MNGSRVTKATAVVVLIAMGILAMPVGAARPETATSFTNSSVSGVGSTGSATSSAPTYALNTMKNLPVTGSTARGDVFRGTVDIVNFRNRNGHILAIGNVTGRLVRTDGSVVGRVTDVRARMPLTLSDGTNVHTSLSPSAAGTCDILHLRVGAIDLNLLGLVVHLDPIRLDITAQAGPGNLLGNLLCAVSGLLDNVNVNDVLVSLLRAIRQILNGL
jgi:hypothetical protein